MASTLDFIRAIQNRDFVEAKSMFLSLVQPKMEAHIQQEYRATAQNFLSKDKD